MNDWRCDTVSTLLLLTTSEMKKTPQLPSIVYLPSSRRNQVYTIGKSSSCSLTIPCEEISRTHLHIRYDGHGQYSLKSDSTNGTLINGLFVDGKGWIPLKHHDSIFLSIRKNHSDHLCFAYGFIFVTKHKDHVGMRIKTKPVLQSRAQLSML